MTQDPYTHPLLLSLMVPYSLPACEAEVRKILDAAIYSEGFSRHEHVPPGAMQAFEEPAAGQQVWPVGQQLAKEPGGQQLVPVGQQFWLKPAGQQTVPPINGPQQLVAEPAGQTVSPALHTGGGVPR